jgi:hypothetical protein
MKIDDYFEMYVQLLDSIILHTNLASFDISTEADRSKDIEKLNLLFEHRNEVKEKLYSFTETKSGVNVFLSNFRGLTEKTNQIATGGKVSQELQVKLYILYRFFADWAELAGVIPEPTTTTDYGKLQFDETTLQKVYVNFADADIWEPIEMDEFIDNFREVPKLSLKIIDKPLFSYILHHFKQSFADAGDKNKWVKQHFGIANFGNSQNLDYSNSDKAAKLEAINSQLDKMDVRKNK